MRNDNKKHQKNARKNHARENRKTPHHNHFRPNPIIPAGRDRQGKLPHHRKHHRHPCPGRLLAPESLLHHVPRQVRQQGSRRYSRGRSPVPPLERFQRPLALSPLPVGGLTNARACFNPEPWEYRPTHA